MIKLIIFDVGGVILHFNDRIYKNIISKKFKINYRALSNVIDPILFDMDVGKASMTYLEKTMKTKFHLSKNDLAWNSTYQRIAKVDPKMIALIRRLSKKYEIAMLTNTCRSRYVYALHKFIDKDLFDGRFASCYLGMRKPDARIFKYVLRIMNCKASESIFIDNMRTNVLGANKVGICGITFKSSSQLIDEMKAFGIKA